jgi:Tol biopolymer transport system component
VSTRDGSPYIYVATADGSLVKRLTKGENPAWSWGGQQIAFNRVAADGNGLELRVIASDGTGERLLPVSGRQPAWSPDGAKLVFVAPGGIYSANADGSNLMLLVKNDFVESGDELSDPTWSPDGKSVAFVRMNFDEDGPIIIYVAKADGSEPRQLVWGDSPRWSPDGSMIAFYLRRPADVLIASVNADGSGLRTRVGENPLDIGDWSPDGRSLLFSHYTAASRMRIFIRDTLGVSIRQLIPEAAAPTSGNYRDYQAVWSRALSPWD